MVLFNYMAFNLHTSVNHSDWGAVPGEQRNSWQRIAAKTHGIVTPGNIVSCSGAALVGLGLWYLMQDVTLTGVFLVAIGRLADAVDGYIADKTKTKSRIGEAIDSTMDKLVAGATIITIFAYHLLPTIVVIAIAAHTIINSIVAIIGKFRKIDIHPSFKGKIATLLIWVTILMYLLYYVIENKTDTQYAAEWILAGSWLLFVSFMIIAIQSTAGYIAQIRR